MNFQIIAEKINNIFKNNAVTYDSKQLCFCMPSIYCETNNFFVVLFKQKYSDSTVVDVTKHLCESGHEDLITGNARIKPGLGIYLTLEELLILVNNYLNTEDCAEIYSYLLGQKS